MLWPHHPRTTTSSSSREARMAPHAEATVAEHSGSPGGPDGPAKEPLTGFHLRVTATTFGANFSDGYALGVIGAVLPALDESMHLSGAWEGLLGASALIGLFFGSILLG